MVFKLNKQLIGGRKPRENKTLMNYLLNQTNNLIKEDLTDSNRVKGYFLIS